MLSAYLCYFCLQVEKKRREDADNGVKIAKSLEGFVERKVCDVSFLLLLLHILLLLCHTSSDSVSTLIRLSNF